MEHRISEFYEEMLESTIKSIEKSFEMTDELEKQFGKHEQIDRFRNELEYAGTVNLAVKKSLEQERTGRVIMNINRDFWIPVNRMLPEVKLYSSEPVCDHFGIGPAGELVPMHGGKPIETPIIEDLYESSSVLVTGDFKDFDGHMEHGVFFARYQEAKENGELVGSRWSPGCRCRSRTPRRWRDERSDRQGAAAPGTV